MYGLLITSGAFIAAVLVWVVDKTLGELVPEYFRAFWFRKIHRRRDEIEDSLEKIKASQELIEKSQEEIFAILGKDRKAQS